MNEAFEILRQHTSTSTNHRLPKVTVRSKMTCHHVMCNVVMVQVEILRNAILYIQSLERCLGLSCDRGGDSEEDKKENVEQEVPSSLQPDPGLASPASPQQPVTSLAALQHRQRFQSKIIYILDM